MARYSDVSGGSLPRGWPRRVKSAVLHVISLAQYALASVQGWAADCRNVHVRRSAEASRLDDEIALLREEIRWKTPNEVFFGRSPANERLRFEPRTKFPRDSLCAAPYAAIRGRRGQKLELVVLYFADRKYLPLSNCKRSLRASLLSRPDSERFPCILIYAFWKSLCLKSKTTRQIHHCHCTGHIYELQNDSNSPVFIHSRSLD
jgi:hypothetical protein